MEVLSVPKASASRGRGARPRWLVAAIKGGKKVDDFLIRNRRKTGGKSVGRSVNASRPKNRSVPQWAGR
jgi:hypothetical protein